VPYWCTELGLHIICQDQNNRHAYYSCNDGQRIQDVMLLPRISTCKAETVQVQCAQHGHGTQQSHRQLNAAQLWIDADHILHAWHRLALSQISARNDRCRQTFTCSPAEACQQVIIQMLNTQHPACQQMAGNPGAAYHSTFHNVRM